MVDWINDWNKIIREVIFKDHELRRLMKIPKNTGVIQFTERYFIRAGYTNKLLTDEVCRITYAETQGSDTPVPTIRRKMITFNIFVKNSELRNFSDDGLKMRTHAIGERLFRLLTSERYLKDTGYRFWPAGDWDLGTRTSGYSRYTIALFYMKVY